MRIDHHGRSDLTRRIASESDVVLISPSPTYSPGTMIEHTMRSRQSTHAFASLRWSSLMEPNEDRARAFETDVTRGALVAENM